METTVHSDFAARLSERARVVGLSRARDFARAMAEHGHEVTDNTAARWLAGISEPQGRFLPAIALITGASLDYLFGLSDSPSLARVES